MIRLLPGGSLWPRSLARPENLLDVGRVVVAVLARPTFTHALLYGPKTNTKDTSPTAAQGAICGQIDVGSGLGGGQCLHRRIRLHDAQGDMIGN